MSARFVLEAMVAREEGRREQALARVREGLAAQPDHAGLPSLLGVLLLETGASESAREVFLRQLAGSLPPFERAIALSNVAWCDFASGRDDRLDEALQCSQEAFAQLGWMPAIQSTRSAVLVWAERPEEALPLLRASLDGLDAPGDRASVSCVAAMSHASLGRRDAAKQALEQARALDDACPLLPRAGAAVG